MTHDDLLAKMFVTQGGPIYQALRAVVELHKPLAGWEEVCEGCGEEWDGSPVSMYPCPTIKAITEQLG